MKNKRWIYYIIVVILVAFGVMVTSIVYNSHNKKTTADKTNTKEIQETATKTKDDGEKTAASDDSPKKGYTMVDLSVWTTDTVNMRADDNTDAEVLAKVPRREELHCIATGSEWYQVQYEEKTGYVSAAYLTTEEPAANSYVVVIDPGHQGRGDSTTEPNGPGSVTMKARVAGGTHGTTTGVYEYELTLAISQQLQTELQNRGYTVYMTRTSHDVNISNMERAQYATSVGADIAVRIHANGAENASVSGAMALAPSSSNPYISYLSDSSWNLSQCVLNSYCQATGMRNQGVTGSDTMTGINWSTVPVTILEMGYMTNPTDDTNMENPSYQSQMVQGIANGIDAYFGL